MPPGRRGKSDTLERCSGLRGELDVLLQAFTGPWLWLVVLGGLTLIVAAYQGRPDYFIDVGGPLDAPYVEGMHAREKNPEFSYRWTQEQASLLLPGIGQESYKVSLKAQGWRPEGMPSPKVKVTVDGAAAGEFQSAPDLQAYELNVTSSQVQQGDLTIGLTPETFRPQNDSRDLGVAVDWVKVEPLPSGSWFTVPPLLHLLYFVLASLIFFLLLFRLGVSPRFAAAGGLFFALSLSAVLIVNRLWLTVYSGQMAFVLAVTYLLAVVAQLALGLLYRRNPLSSPERHWLTAIFAFAFLVRFGGVLYPQIYVMDLGFHMHRLEDVLRGNFFFTVTSGEFGGQNIPYPPGVYFFLLIPNFLFRNEELVVRLFTVLFDTVGLLFIFHLARRIAGRSRPALLAAAVYVLMPISFLIFSWGVTANIFGQLTGLVVLVGVVTLFDRLHRWPYFVVFVFLFALALLAHVEMVLLLSVVVILALLFLWIFRREKLAPGNSKYLLAACLLGAAIAFGLYYSHLVGTVVAEAPKALGAKQTAVAEATYHTGGSVADGSIGLKQIEVHSIGELLAAWPKGLGRELRGYFRIWPAVAALLGLALLYQSHLQKRTFWLAAAWLLAAATFATVGMLTGLFVRYMLFTLPVIALGSGLLLDSLFRRGWVGRLMVSSVILYFAWEGLLLWYNRVMYAFH